jgi:hypothetical protein
MKKLNNIPVEGWLVWYSEYDIHPVLFYYKPQRPEDYYRIDSVLIMNNPKEQDAILSSSN